MKVNVVNLGNVQALVPASTFMVIQREERGIGGLGFSAEW